MAHPKEDNSYDFIYYAVALFSGLFTGAIIDKGFIWIPIGGILGLLTAAFFINVLVRGREEV